MPENMYAPAYGQSHALVIGINDYERATPLERATNDASGFAHLLRERFEFTEDNVTILTDGRATRTENLAAVHEVRSR